MHDWKYIETVRGWDPELVYKCTKCGATEYTYPGPPSKVFKITISSSILPGYMVDTDQEWYERVHDFNRAFPKGASCEESIVWLNKWGIKL